MQLPFLFWGFSMHLFMCFDMFRQPLKLSFTKITLEHKDVHMLFVHLFSKQGVLPPTWQYEQCVVADMPTVSLREII